MQTLKTQIWAVVPAAGIGSRMQAKLPKQYLPLLGSTVLDITLGKILDSAPLTGMVVALNQQDTWWCKSRFLSHPRVFTCSGGKERADSVLNALLKIRDLSASVSSTSTACSIAGLSEKAWVLVHDAARPCVDKERIAALLSHCLELDIGGILAAPVADTLKKVTGERAIVNTLDRQHIWQAHTPQFFPYLQLRNALEYCLLNQLTVTDEASAVEQQGAEVCVFPDRRDNIKITLPEDLAWAEHILQQQTFSLDTVCRSSTSSSLKPSDSLKPLDNLE